MMARPQVVTLTPEEDAIFASIRLDPSELDWGEDTQRNGCQVSALMDLLLERKAIPEVRLRYFADPEYDGAGRGRSYDEVFRRNGNRSRKEIFEHPHFLEHLRYFLHGPRLPDLVIEDFCCKVDDCHGVTSSDVQPLAKHARSLARGLSLEPYQAAEEFYKLALESGIHLMWAPFIRDAVKKLPRRR